MSGLLQFPDGAAFGVGSPAETAQQPSGMAGLLGGAYEALGLLAKRAFGASEMMRQTGVYNPAPMVDAAMLPMGTGAIAGVPVRAGEALLGAGAVRGSPDMSHWNALNVRLSNERNYLAKAKTPQEQELRKIWIAQIEKEIAQEEKFLGKQSGPLPEISDDDLLKELMSK